MKRTILICIAILLITSLAFANTSNSLNSFKIHYDPDSSQLTAFVSCKSGGIATLSLSNNFTRDITCDTTGLVPQTMLIPVIETGTPLTATLSILPPCDVCNISVNVLEEPTNNWGAMAMILGAIVLFAVVFVMIFNKLGEHPRY